MTDIPVHRVRTSCRACGASRLSRFLDLGDQPLANAFLRSPDQFATESRFPLGLYRCGGCHLVQLCDVIDPKVLFRNYLYVTGTSDTIAGHNARYAATVVARLKLGAAHRVVEVASNDGSLLKHFRDHGVKTLGVEPARNIAARARADGLETLERFFDESVARSILASHGPAHAVVANNVLAHVDDPQDFLRGARRLLAPGGELIVEVPYLGHLLDCLEYDTVYHEHLSYFSIGSLTRLYDAVGLTITQVDDVPVHGGSVRVYATAADRASAHAPAVLTRIESEHARGLQQDACYAQFASRVASQRRDLQRLLSSLQREGATLAGYGAPAKGNTLLNYCGIGNATLPYTVDKNAMKVGLYTPGTHVPVLPVSTVLERRPDYLVILAWNFATEIIRQQAEYSRRGGRFIVPIPEPMVVS